MNMCKTCKWWDIREESQNFDEILFPEDPKTFEPMTMPFEVRECLCPDLLFNVRPKRPDQATTYDGEGYKGGLKTGCDFGCTNHEEATCTAKRHSGE